MSTTTPAIKRFTLLFTIQSAFLTICLLLAGSLSFYGYLKAKEAALVAGEKQLQDANLSILLKWQHILEKPKDVARYLPTVPGITVKPVGTAHPARPLLVHLIAGTDSIHSIYAGWNDGDFFMVARVESGTSLETGLSIPAGTHYLARYVTDNDGRRIAETAFLDANGNALGESVILPSTYDPRERPWFKKTDGVFRSPVYKFASTSDIGATFSNDFAADGGGVFGVDVKLDDLAAFLRSEAPGPDGRIVVFDDAGKVVLHDRFNEKDIDKYEAMTVDDLGSPAFSAIFQAYTEKRITPGQPFSLNVQGEPYIGLLTASLKKNPYKAAIFAPEIYFTADAIRLRNNCMIVSAVIILIAVVAVVTFSRKISTPLRKLALDTDRVRRFELDTEVNIHSRIREVSDLASSIRSMKEGLRSFTQYVPTDLVKRYIKTDTAPKIGGDRRTLTLLFTDIEGFTTLSESLSPHTIIAMLSDYFGIMGGMVTKCGGTVDKYIGDALMAFWNAPQQNEAHTRLGCEAALRCALAVRDFQYRSPADGTATPLRTRFGLHRGETVVGNVGSSDRLNYTALGSVVNMASRLEGLNKQYGTAILASEEVKNHAGKYFVFRSVDRVLPKGALTPVNVFELAGSTPKNGTPELEITMETHVFLAEWEAMFSLYQARRWDEALARLETMDLSDALVRLYMERVRNHLETAPAPDWDGVSVMTEK